MRKIPVAGFFKKNPILYQCLKFIGRSGTADSTQLWSWVMVVQFTLFQSQVIGEQHLTLKEVVLIIPLENLKEKFEKKIYLLHINNKKIHKYAF